MIHTKLWTTWKCTSYECYMTLTSWFSVLYRCLNTPICCWGIVNRDKQCHSITHYGDVIMGMIASQMTCLTIVYSTVYVDADQRKHQSFASLAFVREIHRGPVNSPHKRPVTRKMFPFDDVIMDWLFHILMPHNMIILNYSFPYFHVSNSISVLSFYIDVVLTLSIRMPVGNMPDLDRCSYMCWIPYGKICTNSYGKYWSYKRRSRICLG